MKLSEKIVPNFHKAWREIDNHIENVFKGGRSSSKSTTVSCKIIIEMMKMPVNGLAIRRFEKYVERSVFEQLKWAINYLEVQSYWKVNKSPLKLTYLPRGNSIIFAGADDPTRIKSIISSDFPIAILWIEELADFKCEEDVDTIQNSIVRGILPLGINYKVYKTYNPPKRKQNWCNKKYESVTLPKHIFVHHSTYLDNPFNSEEFKLEAESIKAMNPLKYRWIYLGEAIGGGVVPFNNLKFEAITDEQIRSFDHIRQGLDWGYATDPVAFTRQHYDKTRRILYLFDEIYKVQMSNRELAQLIIKKGYNREMITCDSAEPKSIAELKEYGLLTRGAKKGAGSVEYGEKWLDDLEAIVIDPKRCPNSAKEFENIDYKVDRFGDITNKLEDKDNHIIDASRYSCENDMTNNKVKTMKRSLLGL